MSPTLQREIASLPVLAQLSTLHALYTNRSAVPCGGASNNRKRVSRRKGYTFCRNANTASSHLFIARKQSQRTYPVNAACHKLNANKSRYSFYPVNAPIVPQAFSKQIHQRVHPVNTLPGAPVIG